MKLILARHGTAQEAGTSVWLGRRLDPPLTPSGQEEAHTLGLYLLRHELHPQRFISGPLQRQRETLAIVRHTMSEVVPPEIEPDLCEVDYGAWEGKTDKEVQTQWPEAFQAWTKDGRWSDEFADSETLIHTRLRTWLDTLQQQTAPDDIIFAVTSHGILKSIYRLITKERAENVYRGNFCVLESNGNGWSLVNWNQSPA